MLLKRLKSFKKVGGVGLDFWIVVGLFLTFSLLYSLLAVTVHNHFQSQGVDFSIYDQALWLYSRFQSPFSTITFLYDLADRFRPIMLPISVLYWFSENERVILIFQAIILAAAVFPLWLLAKRKVSSLLALTLSFAYLNFVGTQAVNAYGFHEMALLPIFLGFLLLFLEKRQWRNYFIALLLCLAVRENVGFLTATIGVWTYIRSRNFKAALATILISVTWSVLAIALIMPAMGQSNYGSFVKGGDSLPNALLGYLKDPLLILRSFFLPFEKTMTISWSFLAFGFVPLFFPPLGVTILYQFASRFLDLMHPIRWTPYYHYSAELGILMIASTIYGASYLTKKFPKYPMNTFLVAIILLGQIVSTLGLHMPLKNLLKKNFYAEEPWMANTQKILSMVPRDASVAAQNNLLPHLSHRKSIYLLPDTHNAQYLVFDLHEGQNNWNFYNGNLDVATGEFKELINKGAYKIVASSGDAYLLKIMQ